MAKKRISARASAEKIENLKAWVLGVFIKNSPRYEVKIFMLEMREEAELLSAWLRPLRALLTVQEVSRISARHCYQFWRARGFRKVRQPLGGAKWTNEKTALKRAIF